ncbi:MAG TPA: hypothetical protein PKH19_01290, partial [Candidatus Syntrophosphaera sp.]|nr:hypothetical protein [Candidatus Syntrophosphaera sp.]
MLLLLLFGLLLLRFATRQLLALLFQLPPRFTRFDPLLLSLPQIMAQFLQARSGIGNSAEGDHALHRPVQFGFPDQPVSVLALAQSYLRLQTPQVLFFDPDQVRKDAEAQKGQAMDAIVEQDGVFFQVQLQF